jgi:hypothetical protein
MKIFGPQRNEIIGGWRKLHNMELHNLYCSANIIEMIKSRRIRWARHEEQWVHNIKMDHREKVLGWYGPDKSGSG